MNTTSITSINKMYQINMKKNIKSGKLLQFNKNEKQKNDKNLSKKRKKIENEYILSLYKNKKQERVHKKNKKHIKHN